MSLSNVILLIFLLFSISARLELLLVEKDGESIKAIDFKNADEQKKLKLLDIYKNIINRYQFPMLSISYALEDKNTQELIEKLLTSTTSNLVEETLINHFIQQKYGDEFSVIYVPNTLFEASSILTIFADIDTRPIPTSEENDLRPHAYFKYTFPGDLARSFWNFYNDKYKQNNNDTQEHRRAEFLRDTYGPYNVRDDIVNLYFNAASDLVATTSLKRLRERDFTASLDLVFDKFANNEKKVQRIIKNKAKSLADPFEGKVGEYVKTIFRGDEGQRIIKTYLSLEEKAAQQGEYLIVRGTKGLVLNDDQRLLDLPYLELKTDFDKVVGINDALKISIQKSFGLQEPTKLTGIDTSFEPVALSFANSLLAGSIGEIAKETGGARTLDYLTKDSQIGYAIPIKIIEYLKKDAIKDAFFISPFNSLVGLLANGEFFHSRNKISFFSPDKNWSSSVKSFQSTTAGPTTTFLADFSLGIGAFTAPSKDWPTLAAHITDIIAQRAIIFYKGGGIKDTDDELKAAQHAAATFLLHSKKLEQSDLVTKIKDTTNSVMWGSLNIIDGVVRNMIKSTGIDLLSPKDERFYNAKNPFYLIAQDPKNPQQRTTDLIKNTENAFVIGDLRPRTKIHLLAIPKGNYISFPHFLSHAKPEEIRDLFRALAEAAESKGLDKTGYRIISNHAENPRGHDERSMIDNHANQEIPHVHVHIAGGECLGKPVAAITAPDTNMVQREITGRNDDIAELQRFFRFTDTFKFDVLPDYTLYKNEDHVSLEGKIKRLRQLDKSKLGLLSSPPFMGIDHRYFPWGIGLSEQEFLALIKRHLILSVVIDESGSKLLVYKIPAHAAENIPVYLGATILDRNDKPLYRSIHDFAKIAPTAHIIATITMLTSLSAVFGTNETGYRLIANHGADGWQIPRNTFQIFIAGGKPLGITVSNVIGNKYPGQRERSERDYNDMPDVPHEHCPKDPALALRFAGDLKETVNTNQETLTGLKNASDELQNINESLKIFAEDTKNMPQDDQGYEELIKKIVTMREKQFLKLSRDVKKIKFGIEKLEKTPLPQNLSKAEEYRSELIALEFGIMAKTKKYFAQAAGEVNKIWYITSHLKGTWIFIDLDRTLTKNYDSTELTEKDLIQQIKLLQQKGTKVLALTNRHYWPTMGETGTTLHRNTFTLLTAIDTNFLFSNPGKITEGVLRNFEKPGQDVSYFKDGVIFCADNKGGKGQCLKDYLLRLARETDVTMPDAIQFIDDDRRNTDNVVKIMRDLKLPIEALHYEPL